MSIQRFNELKQTLFAFHLPEKSIQLSHELFLLWEKSVKEENDVRSALEDIITSLLESDNDVFRTVAFKCFLSDGPRAEENVVKFSEACRIRKNKHFFQAANDALHGPKERDFYTSAGRGATMIPSKRRR